MDFSSNSSDAWSFISDLELQPPKIDVIINKPGTAEGLIFITPHAASEQPSAGQPGSLIVDREGNPVWFRPTGNPNGHNGDLQKQEFNGQTVLSFWQTGPTDSGARWQILDNSYRTLKIVQPHAGYNASMHEFLITPQNSVLCFGTKSIPTDLSPYGGPKDGRIIDYAIQEIDLNTNALLFFWSALENIPPTESYAKVPTPGTKDKTWDPYHFNSIGFTDNPHDIIVSGRHTWTIYRINKPTGVIQWQLGGKHSDFNIGPKARFAWQHDARFLPNNIISLFDNFRNGSGNPPDAPPSHGLLLSLNYLRKTAMQYKSYFHDPELGVTSQGDMQNLSNGNKFIGWGQKPFFSEYKEPGQVLYDAKILGNNQSYRAFVQEWVGTPYYPPSIGTKSCNSHTTVYASWNGTTETRRWHVLAGNSPTSLSLIAIKEKSGFETSITVHTEHSYFQVVAINHKGLELARSKIVKLD